MMPVAERVDLSTSRVPHRLALTLTVLQFWAVAAYLIGGAALYAWPGLQYDSLLQRGIPEWLLVVPGLLFVAPGFWMAAFGTFFGTVFTAAGALVLATLRRHLSTRAATWLTAGSLLTAGVLIFSLTPLGDAVRIYILD